MISRLLRPAFSLQAHSRRLFAVHSFTDLDELNTHLAKKQAICSIVYFRAGWNPQCDEADRHIEQISKEYSGYEIVKVDSDKALKIAHHYSVKNAPEFVICLFGDEFTRQIGPNLPALKQKLEKADKVSHEADLSCMQKKWVPYGTAFEQYYEAYLRPRLNWNR